MYEAPRMTEVGSVHGLTLGNPKHGPRKDNSNWFDIWGDPGNPGHPPVGSR
ncbi:lasso RiPP family leader peptide-containing protein [Georgenia sp. H159]|uniref:lasso RiPP family leader peptide-containing protein n=1 Tax=Georgenia sp. H159 TaxID=3076115 RepID=UPI002D7829DD|nr:lasso RiPP family leader peptide-containing protein [Georgenia sp. H159]